MQEQHVYEYAVIRVLPRVEREEFINVGVIVFCKRLKFIGMSFHVNEARLAVFPTEWELEQIQENLKAFEEICCGNSKESPIAKEEIAERFRWLTAVRSSCVQTSRPHTGLTSNPQLTLDALFKDLVL